MIDDPILDVNLLDNDAAYNLIVYHGDEMLEEAAKWYLQTHDHASGRPDQFHGAMWRALREALRFPSLRYAFTDTWGPRPGDAPLPPLPPLPTPHPGYAPLHLEVRGADFVDASGAPTCYSGVDMFPAFRMWLDGRIAELEALRAESLEFGFVWWRVFFQGSKAQNQIFDLSPNESDYDAEVPRFLDWAGSGGTGILGDVFVDNQDLKTPYSQFSRMADHFRNRRHILSGGNEAPKNGWDPAQLPNPGGGVVWSRGSSLADEVTPPNGATCASFHQRTDFPKTLLDAVASAVEMSVVLPGYGVIMCDEPTRFNFDGTNKSGVPDSPRFALSLALCYRACWDLVIFHNQAGQRGQLMTPELRTIAAQWARGLSA